MLFVIDWHGWNGFFLDDEAIRRTGGLDDIETICTVEQVERCKKSVMDVWQPADTTGYASDQKRSQDKAEVVGEANEKEQQNGADVASAEDSEMTPCGDARCVEPVHQRHDEGSQKRIYCPEHKNYGNPHQNHRNQRYEVVAHAVRPGRSDSKYDRSHGYEQDESNEETPAAEKAESAE